MAPPGTESSLVQELAADAARVARGLRHFALFVGSTALIGYLAIGAGPWLRGAAPAAEAALSRPALLQLALLIFAVIVYGAVRVLPTVEAFRHLLGAMLYLATLCVVGVHDVLQLGRTDGLTSAGLAALLTLTYPLLVFAPRGLNYGLIAVSALYLPIGALLAHVLGALGPTASLTTVLFDALLGSMTTWIACGVALFVVMEPEAEDEDEVEPEDEVDRIGSYTLDRKIGQGGMGEVWRARHEYLAREVALKVVRVSDFSVETTAEALVRREQVLLKRFEREAQSTAMLTSPHTVKIHDYGSTDDDRFYYVMELLQGMDLWRLVTKRGTQPEELVHHVLSQACDSLGEAHEQGLVHRDLKPANLFLCRQGMEFGFVKVLDFGLVKSPASLRGQQTSTHARLTGEGMVSGTPGYMSPEQARGRRDLDGRSDLYALGCVAYFMLTGHDLFEGQNPIEIMLGQIERTPTPMRGHVPDLQISRTFEAVIDRLLMKRRRDRFQSAQELKVALAACRFPNPWTAERSQALWASSTRRSRR